MTIFIFIVLIFIFSIIYFFKTKLSTKNKIDYYRDIPSDESPAVVGYMIKNNCDGNDVVATLLDLSYRGYIDIKYELVNGVEKSIISLTDKDRFMVLKDFENFLLDELFKENKEIVLDDYLSSNKFKEIFVPFGNMIKKRVDLKSIHKPSIKKNRNKVIFTSIFVTLGFSIFFPILYFFLRDKIDILYILGISYVINFGFFYLYKFIIEKSRYKLEQRLINYSYIFLILFIGILVILYLINNSIFISDSIVMIISNIVMALLLIISLFKPLYKSNKDIPIFDYLFIVYGFISIVFLDIVGISISTLYLALKIYILSPKHINLMPETDIEKWMALKKYLDDFTIINEREEKEVSIWKKYLIYAISMGVNKKCILKYSDLLKIKLINENTLNKFYIEKIDY